MQSIQVASRDPIPILVYTGLAAAFNIEPSDEDTAKAMVGALDELGLLPRENAMQMGQGMTELVKKASEDRNERRASAKYARLRNLQTWLVQAPVIVALLCAVCGLALCWAIAKTDLQALAGASLAVVGLAAMLVFGMGLTAMIRETEKVDPVPAMLPISPIAEFGIGAWLALVLFVAVAAWHIGSFVLVKKQLTPTVGRSLGRW